MSLAFIIAVGIVIASSVGAVVAGEAYKWDLTSRGYTRWTRAIGVAAVVSLTGVAALDRWGKPWLVAAIVAAGVLLATVFLAAHRRLTARLIAALK